MDLQRIVTLAAIIEAAQTKARVAYLTVDHDVLYGTARNIVEPNVGEDVNDAHLRVTLDQGVEMFWNIGVLANKLESGEFVVNPSE